VAEQAVPDMDAPRCRALDDNGRRCRRLAFGEYEYFGDRETHGMDDATAGWVLVPLCLRHGTYRKPRRAYRPARKVRS
jgi:hypothetical protein